MPFQDFREFLAALRKHGAVFDVDRPVAFVFKNNSTLFPLVAGVYNTRARALLALKASEETVVALYYAWDRGQQGPGNRNPRHRALSLRDHRQADDVVQRLAEPPLRQAYCPQRRIFPGIADRCPADRDPHSELRKRG
jgi:3-polyprenyl-4-hydroxybenzoate decarboxylase